MIKYNFAKLILALIIISVISCSELELKSKWNEKEISIDGKKQDWEGNLNYFDDEKVALGITNDEENIYICLLTSDRSKVMKILNNGFTIWFESPNNDKNNFGVQYPIRKEFSGKMEIVPEMKDRNEFGQKNNSPSNEGKFENKLIEKFKAEQDEILIVDDENFPLNVYKLKNDSGLEVFVNIEQNQLVYELRIPYAQNIKNKIYYDAEPNDEINLRFASGEIEKHDFIDREGGKRGGMRNPDGDTNEREFSQRARKGEMGERPGMNDMMKPIEFNVKILLASKN
ncbi:MAG: hypothetical protein IPK06_11045 [Ignavibacteriae bacterium]|nr:hypothetical protein [Ignavibacteriota bacterium]